VVLTVHQDPDNPDHRVLAVAKNNLTKHPPSLSFSLKGTPQGAARIEWLGERDLTADHLMEARAGLGARQSPAADWLTGTLLDGPMERSEVVRRGVDAGFSTSTIDRAARAMGLSSRLEGFGVNHKATWSLPLMSGEPASEPSSPAIGTDDNDDNNDKNGHAGDVEADS